MHRILNEAMDLRFILVTIGTSLVISAASIMWPKLTTKARPQALQVVHDVVIKTSAGQQLSNVLGVTDETSVQPINISSVASTVANGAVSALTKQAQNVVVTQATNEIAKQYDQLSPDQKQVLENIICKPTP